MSKPFFSPESIDTPLHREWQQQRALRHRIRLDETWRGCMGLAMLLSRPDDTEYHGSLALVRNEQLTWLALRDVPVGHFPTSPIMNRRDVQYANTAVAELRHGMPIIDFRQNVREAIDFRFMPFAPHLRRFGKAPWDVERVQPGGDTLDSAAQAREFAVLNRVSADMTRFAFGAVDAAGQPVRKPWAEQRPADCATFRPPSPLAWMPKPYLAFPKEMADRLYWSATESTAGETVWECPSCHRANPSELLRTSPRARIELLESGDFVAGCVHCGRRRKWFLEDGRPCRIRRRFLPAFQERFCRAVATGVKATAIGPEVYCGMLRNRDDRGQAAQSGPRLDLIPHRLRSKIDGRVRVVYLPRSARVTARAGDTIEPGETWADVTPPASASWRARSLSAQWGLLHEPCGGPAMVGFLQRLWFEQQMVRVAAAPGQILVPADLAALAVRDWPPVGLWWDTAPAMAHYDWQLQAAMFPPLRLRHWDGFVFSLPGDVSIDASIVDPRFSVRRTENRKRIARRESPSKAKPTLEPSARRRLPTEPSPARLAG